MEIIINFVEENEYVSKNKAEKVINDLIDQFSHNITLESLEYIVIPNDFGAELTNFQAEHGLIQEYTNDENGRAFGKTLSYESNGEFKNTIFIDKGIIFAIIMRHEQLYETSIHLIHHELSHIHDNFMKYKMFGIQYMLRDRGNLNTVLKIHADSIWSEYIANKLSISTISKDNDLEVSFLLKLIEAEKKQCMKVIEKYNQSNNALELYNGIQLHSFNILRMASTVYGNLDGIKGLCESKTYENICKSISILIGETYFFDIWAELCEQLKNMNNSYPNWEDETIVSELGEIVLKLWNKFGVYPTETGEGRLFFDVIEVDI